MEFGKSYGIKNYVIKKFIKKKEKFLYIRRYDNELKSLFQKDFFGDIRNAFPEVKLSSNSRKFYLNGEVFGYAKRLTEAQDLKSSSFEDITTIVFDEYAIEKNKRYYLSNEGMIIAGLLDSVIRNRNNVKVFFLMNAVEGIEFSPLFTFFNLTLPYSTDIKLFKNNTVLVQYMNNEEFRQERKETLIGKLMEGTLYENYAMKNEILDKTNDFIEKKSGTSKFSFAFIYNKETFGVWNDFKNGKVYVSNDYLDNNFNIYSLTLKDSKPNVMMIGALSRYDFWKNFLKNFKYGVVYFENQKIKHNVFEILRLYNSIK